MTSKMQSCVDHIKTSLNVDPWAMELVEQVFAEYDARFDKVLEIIDGNYPDPNAVYGFNEYEAADVEGQEKALDRVKDAVVALKGGVE